MTLVSYYTFKIRPFLLTYQLVFKENCSSNIITIYSMCSAPSGSCIQSLAHSQVSLHAYAIHSYKSHFRNERRQLFVSHSSNVQASKQQTGNVSFIAYAYYAHHFSPTLV